MAFYEYNFVALILTCAFLKYRQHQQETQTRLDRELDDGVKHSEKRPEADHFTKLFLVVYLLVMGADWLQGPYVYALYKDEMGLTDSTVAALFATGFVSGAVSGYFVGSLADKYGRRTACQIFCFTYSCACFSTLVSSKPLLFFGRVLGGLSTSMLYSAFESWMVTEFHKRDLADKGGNLSNIFGTMTTMNSIVAIIAGVFSEWLVELTGTKRAPFMASAVCLGIAFWVMLNYWSENYGDSTESSSSGVPAKSALRLILEDKRLLAIGLASCFFEGSMYLFVFFWTPALKATRAGSSAAFTSSAAATGTNTLPFGIIFACFMCAVMLGSLLFTLLIGTWSLVSPSRLLSAIFALASSTFLMAVVSRDERVVFWSFCVFEACVGLYWPSAGYLKGKVVDDGVRGRVYGMLRVPLNVFVVVALTLTREGNDYRDTVFMACSGFLLVASGVFQTFVVE
ncbi:MAG: hypothetical protein M1817_003209 [Caeruleum heppii]|nr:MAG: hypothetical protein M1817_003209 [Caeruleum heppii]